jgi:hypothetical protein
VTIPGQLTIEDALITEELDAAVITPVTEYPDLEEGSVS